MDIVLNKNKKIVLVPSYPTVEAIAVIESELGVKVSEVFQDLDENTRLGC